MVNNRLMVSVIRLSFCSLLLQLSSLVKGQFELSQFISNASHKDSLQKKELLDKTSDYDLVISLTRSGYWNKAFEEYIIARRDEKWSSFIIYTNFYTKKHERLAKKIKYVKHKISTERADSIWSFVKANKLLFLNVDTLKDCQKVVNSKDTIESIAELEPDSNGKKIYRITSQAIHRQLLSVSDGTNYEFVIKFQNQLRVIGCYEPDWCYKFLPGVIERKYFIDCRDAFYRWF